MDQTTKGMRLTETYWSLAEFADTAASRASKWLGHHQNERSFTHVDSFADAVTLAKQGWRDELDAALELAESAIKMANQEHMVDSFMPVWDVTGAEVDVARYLSGEPECMIDFPLTRTSKHGRVITLVTSQFCSSSISVSTRVRRGRLIVALALALSQLGHATEIWVDFNLKCHGKRTSYQRVLVKGVNDELDPSQIIFALAHPAMQRGLQFGTADGFPELWEQALGRSGSYGRAYDRPAETVNLYPEGTIFLPGLVSGYDVPDADQFLRKYLGELGLLAE